MTNYERITEFINDVRQDWKRDKRSQNGRRRDVEALLHRLQRELDQPAMERSAS